MDKTKQLVDEPIEPEIEATITIFRNVWKWSSYDAADTMFSQSILSTAFQPFMLLLAYDMGVTNYWDAFILLSGFMAIANLIIAALCPIVGSISDTMGKRKGAVLISASLIIVSTLGFLIYRNFWWGIFMFFNANMGYRTGRMFYDSMIPFIAKTDERGKTSAISGALSFLGTLVAISLGLLAFKIWGEYSKPEEVFSKGKTVNYGGLPNIFWLTVIAFVIITIPFIFSKEKENPNQDSLKKNVERSLKTLKGTIKEIIQYKNAWIFFLIWFFVTDASNTTILYMTVIMVDGGGATPTQTLYIIAVGAIVNIISAILFGILLDKKGPKTMFKWNILGWLAAGISVIFVCIEINGKHLLPWYFLFLTSIVMGLGMGGLWLVGRQFIYEIAPPSKVAQYSGVKQISGRVSAIVSPIIFLLTFSGAKALGLSIPNSYAISIVPLILFFLLGYVLLRKYQDVHEQYLKGERAPYNDL